ncbi:hypothetical protein MRB53_018433 [Persea americana]|uniref:Uncharacterized protein n=1 Tax=Persea americana TaxID=3435 RepID=A0ACC2M7T1_PERAE|nr:hypothetical protein MRB53_018433 [Persea americana]
MARSYEDFEPMVDWAREGESHIYTVDLPEFKREHLKLQLDSSGILNITGECPVEGNKWRRFRKEALVPEKCNPSNIQAKFEDGILYVVFPKPITREDIYEASQSEESPVGQKTGEMPDSINNHNDTHSTGGRGGAGGGTGDKGTTAVGVNKQRTESTDDTNVVNKMKSKDKGKMVHGSRESAGDGGEVKESNMHGGGLVLGLDDHSRQLMENVFVAFLVVVAFVIYMVCKF